MPLLLKTPKLKAHTFNKSLIFRSKSAPNNEFPLFFSNSVKCKKVRPKVLLLLHLPKLILQGHDA